MFLPSYLPTFLPSCPALLLPEGVACDAGTFSSIRGFRSAILRGRNLREELEIGRGAKPGIAAFIGLDRDGGPPARLQMTTRSGRP